MGADRELELELVHRYYAGSYPEIRALANPPTGFMTRLAGYGTRVRMTLDDNGPDVTVPVTCRHCREAVEVRVPARDTRRARQLRARRAFLAVLGFDLVLVPCFVLSMTLETAWPVLIIVLLFGLSMWPIVTLLQRMNIDYMENWQTDDTHVVTVRMLPGWPGAERARGGA